MDEVEHLRLTDLNKSIYKKRKQTIERIFADAKEKQGDVDQVSRLGKKSRRIRC